MAMVVVRSKVVVLLLFVYCCSHCLCGFCVCTLFCFAVLSVLSTFAIISLRKRERAVAFR